MAARRANACQTTTPRFFEHTAETLPQGQVRLGLQQTQVGLVDWFTVGTQPLAWLAPLAVGVTVPNINGKLCLIPWSPVNLSAGAALLYIDTGAISLDRFSAISSTIWLMPLDITLSVHFDERVSIHSKIVYVRSASASTGYAKDVESFISALLVSNMQVLFAPEVRLNDRFALQFLGRLLLHAFPIPVSGEVAIDERTTMHARGVVTPENLQHAWSILPSLAVNFGTLVLRGGIGYGNVFIPGFGIPTPFRMPLADFDLSWRW